MPELRDPNFPKDLSIEPSNRHAQDALDASWDRDTVDDIQRWGIAGRIWEAAYLLRQYLRPRDASRDVEFDPPCSIFTTIQDTRVVELGSGVGYVGIHLFLALGEAHRKAQVILTDLENVCPLLERNAQAARGSLTFSHEQKREVSLEVQPLPWGSERAGKALLEKHLGGPLTHIVCSDLVYFPELLAPLLRTIIQLSDPVKPGEQESAPQLIISYRMRSLAKEQPFWQALGAWFDFFPVYTRHRRRQRQEKGDQVQDGQAHQRVEFGEWHRFGARKADLEDRDVQSTLRGGGEEDEEAEDHYYVFIGERKADSLGCMPPEDDEKLIGGWRIRTKRANDQLEGQEVHEECAASDTFELLLLGDMASL